MDYNSDGTVVTLTFDDGKANVVGPGFLDEINGGLDRAEEEQAGAVILRGREGMFSGGFDLGEFQKGPEAGVAMVKRGFELLIRLYSFPRPLVAASTGHSIALGAFIIMTCDSRIGTRGDFRLSLPETAIGMELPKILVELTASRISPLHMTRAALQSEVYNPDTAAEAGFLDEVVEADALDARALAVAEQLAQLPQEAYAGNKLAVRARTLEAMREGLEEIVNRHG